jgi:hypothetical protein
MRIVARYSYNARGNDVFLMVDACKLFELSSLVEVLIEFDKMPFFFDLDKIIPIFE